MGEYDKTYEAIFNSRQSILRLEIHIKQLQVYLLDALYSYKKANHNDTAFSYEYEGNTYEDYDAVKAAIEDDIQSAEESIADEEIAIGECEGYLAELESIDGYDNEY